MARATEPHDGPITVDSVADRVYAVLRARIAENAIPRGARVHQEDLAREFAVSRTPVREAIGRLAAEGLVELLPNRGARVTTATLEEMESAFYARLVVEPGAARLAASLELSEPMKAMRRAIELQAKPGKPAAHYLKANRDFHMALVEATGNPLLARFMDQIWITRIGAALYESQTDQRQIRADIDAHAEIADAIEAGRAATAEKATRGHIERAMATLFARH